MLYQFDTDSVEHAKAALLIYAAYKSRSQSSPLNGLETWDRCAAFIRGACLKSHTTAEFLQEFCRKGKIESVKPCYLSTGDPVLMPDTGELIHANGVRDYRLNIVADDSLLPILTRESQYVIMLVRERIQREKLMYQVEDEAGEYYEDEN